MRFAVKHSIALIILVAVLLLQSGCATSNIVKKSKKELAFMHLRATQAAGKFYEGEYDEAERIYLELGRQRTVNQPLYQAELGTVYLAKGDEQKAYKHFRQAQVSLESFFDTKSEKRAASYWGSESEKVYKGEPFERSSLYLVLGLLMLNRNEVDNAFACFKSGLLCDSDSQENRYRSDYAMLQLLAAKCCELRNEPEVRDQYMKQALRSFGSAHPDAQHLIAARYDLEHLPTGQSVATIVESLRRIYPDETSALLDKQGVDAFIDEKLQEICYASYYEKITRPFNALLVVWAGRGPDVVRGGKYGELRGIVPGDMSVCDYDIFDNGSCNGAIRGFGSVNYQATTRGGRLMDNVLSSQASFKGFTEDLGGSLIDAADDVGDPRVAAVLMLVGLISKGFSAATKVESDIRTWRTLPAEFQLLPMNLAPGDYDIDLCAYKYATPLGKKPVSMGISTDRPVNVVHIFTHEYGNKVVQEKFDIPASELYPVMLSKVRPDFVDKDGDAMISEAEQNGAVTFIMETFDCNKNGRIDSEEHAAFSSWSLKEFDMGMVQ